MSLELSSVLGNSSLSTCFLSLWPRDLNYPEENADSNHLFSDSVIRQIYKCQNDGLTNTFSVFCSSFKRALYIAKFCYYFFRCSY